MYMTEKQEQILKKYIKKMLLEDANNRLEGSTTLTYELQKPANQAFPIGADEMEKIKEAIKIRYPKLTSFDAKEAPNTNPKQYLEIVFEATGTPTNFYFTIRKIKNKTNNNQFLYSIWFVPFIQKADIDKPGAVIQVEGSPFDNSAPRPTFLSTVYNFFTDALLLNK